MKAIVYRRYGAPDVLQIEEREKPVPGNNEVLIRIHATVVTSADSTFRKGEPYFARLFTGLMKPKKTVLGTELSGSIETIGSNVTRFKVGDQVFGSAGAGCGAYAEYICLHENGAIAVKPANASYEETAGTSEALTALYFLRDSGKIQSGQKVLINGASGAVGIYAVQLAKYFGAEITAVCSKSKHALVKSFGADCVIDYATEDFTQSGETYDIIFDIKGNSSFSVCKRSLTAKGIYLSAVPSAGVLIQMLLTVKSKGKKAIFEATGLRKLPQRAEGLDFLRELVEAGKIKPVIDQTFPMEQIVAAHRYVDQGHKTGSVAVTL